MIDNHTFTSFPDEIIVSSKSIAILFEERLDLCVAFRRFVFDGNNVPRPTSGIFKIGIVAVIITSSLSVSDSGEQRKKVNAHVIQLLVKKLRIFCVFGIIDILFLGVVDNKAFGAFEGRE